MPIDYKAVWLVSALRYREEAQRYRRSGFMLFARSCYKNGLYCLEQIRRLRGEEKCTQTD